MLASAKYDVVGDPDVHLRIPGFVGEVEETRWRGIDDIVDTEPSGVLPPAELKLKPKAAILFSLVHIRIYRHSKDEGWVA